MGNGNNDVGTQSTSRKSGQQQMTAAMPQQGAYVMGDNECAPQKLVRLTGCRDPKVRPERAGADFRARLGQLQLGQTKN